MPFGLTNTAAWFQHMTNTIFKDMEGYIWYINNIRISAGNIEAEHQAIVEKKLQQCVKDGLVVNLLKNKFHIHETIFLRHVIDSQEVNIDPAKLENMCKWPIPTRKKEIQVFLSFANYCGWFIINYSTKVLPLIDMIKDVRFNWVDTWQLGFDELQAWFLPVLILNQFDRTLETIMETEASNQATTGILSQYHVIIGYKHLYPVAYYAKTLFAT